MNKTVLLTKKTHAAGVQMSAEDGRSFSKTVETLIFAKAEKEVKKEARRNARKEAAGNPVKRGRGRPRKEQ